jgi:hypothetical protein
MANLTLTERDVLNLFVEKVQLIGGSTKNGTIGGSDPTSTCTVKGKLWLWTGFTEPDRESWNEEQDGPYNPMPGPEMVEIEIWMCWGHKITLKTSAGVYVLYFDDTFASPWTMHSKHTIEDGLRVLKRVITEGERKPEQKPEWAEEAEHQMGLGSEA